MEITIRAHRQFSRWRDFSVPNAFGQGMGCSKGALRGPSPRALNVQDGLGDLSEGTQSARSTYLDKSNRDPGNRDPALGLWRDRAHGAPRIMVDSHSL